MAGSTRKKRPKVIIVTPYLADANNGNWRTAHRWAELLGDNYNVIIQSAWQGEPCSAVIVLHARRSAPSVQHWQELGKPMPLILTLTGTDLYKDLADDKSAQASVNAASRLIVLQEDAVQFLPSGCRPKTHVVFQSSRALKPASKLTGRLDCIMVGHLREEKDPLTAVRALTLLPAGLPVRLQHIGAALDATLAESLHQLAALETRYHWSGALPHGLTRAAIKRAHLLIHPSRLEGGANVIVEAITAGTPVLASRMSGNVGMLGKSYPGYFEVGDSAGLARLLRQALQDPNYLARLGNASSARLHLFTPAEEKRRLLALVGERLAD